MKGRKDDIRGKDANEEDILASQGFMTDPMPLPPDVPEEPDDLPGGEVFTAPQPEAPVSDVAQLIAAFQASLQVLVAQSSRTETQDHALSVLAGAVDRMTAAQLEGADRVARATKTAARPSNEMWPQISAFNPRGDKDFARPPLKCKMFLPWEAEPESLTREEAELLNLVGEGDYIVTRNDGTKFKLTVRAQYKLHSDKPSVMLFNHETAFNNDNHKLMPPLALVLRQVCRQSHVPAIRRAADLVVTMDEELAYILAGQLNDASMPADGRVVSVGE